MVEFFYCIHVIHTLCDDVWQRKIRDLEEKSRHLRSLLSEQMCLREERDLDLEECCGKLGRKGRWNSGWCLECQAALFCVHSLTSF